MISKAKSTKLVEIFFYVSNAYDKELKVSCQRFSNNNNPEFSDEEIMTVYLFCINQEYRTTVKQIYQFADEYLRSWFPKLPSYAAFNNRINRLPEAFRLLLESLLDSFLPSDCFMGESLLDSLPVVTCSGKRTGKVAPELTDKGYCSTKSMYYYGLKLHSLAYRRDKQLPFPEQLLITPASENDLNVFKNAWSHLDNRTFYGDKIYNDKPYFEDLLRTQSTVMHTPVKGIKNQSQWEKHFDKAANDMLSRAVSAVRQPIEGLFHWLIEKTDFQRASKVRSANGLMVHVFGKLAAAFIFLVFNS